MPENPVVLPVQRGRNVLAAAWAGANNIGSSKLNKDTTGQLEARSVTMADIHQLEQANEKLRLLVELAFEPMLVWDVEKGVLEWNRGCERLYGFTRAEVAGRPIHDLLRRVYPLPLEEFTTQLAAHGEWKGELRHRTKDGHEVVVESHQQTANIGGRRLVLETNHDVTAAKRIELHSKFINDLDLALSQITGEDESLRLMTSRLGEYLGVSRCFVSETDAPAGMIYVRETWQGWRRGVPTIPTQNRMADYVPPTSRERFEKNQTTVVNDVTSDARTHDLAANYLRFDVGAFISVPILSEGHWAAVLSVSQVEPRHWRADEEQLMRDVAARLWLAVKRARALEALRESEARARRTLAEQMVAGVAECDASLKLMMVNQKYCDIVGRTKAELLQMRISDITHPDDWPHNAELLHRLFETGESFFLEKRYLSKNGSDVWVNTHVSAIRNASGEIAGSVAVVIDVTARKRAEEELAAAKDRLAADLVATRSAYEQAEAAARSKDEFVAVISHELRTPLTSILGYARLLQGGAADETQRKRFVDIIERNGKAQLQLIEDLLDTARISSGKLRLEVQPLNFVSAIRAAIDLVQPAAQAKGIEVRDILDPLAGQITGDPERLQQVVWNLLTNAIKYTPTGGSVEVRLERTDPYVQLVVRDSGNGIDPQFLPYIFEPFRQRDMSSTRRMGGLGLGLSLVKFLVELHGGTVDAKNGDPGAIFTIRLPLRAVYTGPTQLKPRKNRLLERSKSLNGVRALIVDDESEVRTLVTLTLEKYGAKAQSAASGKEALELLIGQGPHQRFNILICDISMPDEDGYTFIRKVRALPAAKGGTIPAVALTAYGSVEHRMRALEAGFQTYAVKPVEPDELIIAIRSVIEDLHRKAA